MPDRMTRREFGRRGAVLAGAAALGPTFLRTAAAGMAAQADPLLSGAAKECPIDTVVVLMMENRSFDHYLGWLGTDPPTSTKAAAGGVPRSRCRRANTSGTAIPQVASCATESLTARSDEVEPATASAPGRRRLTTGTPDGLSATTGSCLQVRTTPRALSATTTPTTCPCTRRSLVASR